MKLIQCRFSSGQRVQLRRTCARSRLSTPMPEPEIWIRLEFFHSGLNTGNVEDVPAAGPDYSRLLTEEQSDLAYFHSEFGHERAIDHGVLVHKVHPVV